MSLSTADLAKLLAANPDIELVTDPTACPAVRRHEGGYTTAAPKATGKLSEHELQAAVIAKCDERAITDPRWACIFAIPNGGARDKATGGRLKAEGVRAGVPDLFVAVPSGQFAGLFIELKITGGSVRRSQHEWMQRLRQRGYRVLVLWDDVQTVIDAIDAYLEG